MSTALHDDVEHIRLAAAELPTLSPEERSLLVARVVAFVRSLPRPTAELRERAAELERADPADVPRLEELLREVQESTSAAVQPLGWGYDEAALEHEP